MAAMESTEVARRPEATAIEERSAPSLTLFGTADPDAILAEHFAKARNSVKYDALLWIAYPKQSSKTKADINRDTMHRAVQEWHYDAVMQIAIDEIWSALRFRPKEKVGK